MTILGGMSDTSRQAEISTRKNELEEEEEEEGLIARSRFSDEKRPRTKAN